MRKIYAFNIIKKAILFICFLLAAFNLNTIHAATRTWIGAGAGGAGTDLAIAANWNGGTTLLATDNYNMNFGAATGIFNLTQSASFLKIKSLTISLAAPSSNSAITKVAISISNPLTITSGLSITNSSASAYNDEIDFNVTANTIQCGLVITTATGNGNSSSPYEYINISSNSTMLCTGNWASSCTGNTLTYIKNSGALTISGTTSINNSGTQPIRFLIDNSPAVTTFKSYVAFGDNKNYTGGSNTVLLCGITGGAAGSSGSFVINGDADLFNNMGTENFDNGTLLFDGTSLQAITSYSNGTAPLSPDRTVGNFLVGSANLANVEYDLGAGGNKAMDVSNSLIVNNNCTFSLNSAIIPSDGTVSRTDGLIQVRAGATLNLGIKGGSSAVLPKNYSLYDFDATSTVNYDGVNQVVYFSGTNPGFHYGNLKLSNTGTKTAGGSFTVLGNLEIDDAAVFDANNTSSAVTDSIAGNWTNNSTGGFTSSGTGTTTIYFNGSSNTTIGGTYTNAFPNMILNKNVAATTVSLTNNLTISSTTTLTTGALNINGDSLTLNGNTTTNTNGRLTGSASSALIIGTGSSSITANPIYFTKNVFPGSPYNNYLKTFTLNNLATASLADSLNIASGTTASPGTVTANGNLATGDFLTLKSDINGDARIGYSSGKITGNTIAERFIPARRAWRFLGVPFSGSTQTINAAWQEGQTNTNAYACPTNDPAPAGFGTEITYNNTAGTGYDFNLTTNPSLKVWVNNAWMPPANTNSTNILTPYSAYCIFVRGDRTVCLNGGVNSPPTITVLRIKGILNQTAGGSNSVIKTYNGNAGDFFFLGNPYASAINLQNVINARATGFDADKVWVWDPKLPGSYGDGAYVTYSNGTWSPSGGSYPSGPGNKPIIQSGQAFMVQLSSGSTNAQVKFQEDDKNVSETNVFGKQADAPYPVIYTNLMVQQGNILQLVDGVAAGFGNRFSASVDKDDAVKLWNFDENIALYRDTNYLSIEFRPIPKLTDTLFYKLYLKQQPYTLKIFSMNLTPGMPSTVWLVDKYLNTQTAVNLYDTTLYNFIPNADTNSYRNRFILVLNRELAATPVSVTKIINQADPNISGIANSITSVVNNVSIYPNPISTAGKAILRFNGMEKGSYMATVYNAKGQKLAELSIQHGGGNAVYAFPLKPGWAAGIYSVSIISQELQKTINLKLVISK